MSGPTRGAPFETARRPQRVTALFGADLDAAAWARRHAAGDVPDAFPYGLDRLAAHGFEVRATERALRPRVLQLARGAVRKTCGGMDWWGLPPVPDGPLLAWDERVGAPAALKHGRRTPVVTNVIWATDAPPSRPWHSLLVRGLKRSSAVVVLSSAQVEPLEDWGVPADRLHVLPFGVDADFFDPARSGSPREPGHVVSVGNDRDRDWPTLLKAFEVVHRRVPASRLTIVSSTIDARLVAGAGDAVNLLPRLTHPQIRDLVATAGVCVVSTRPNLHASGITAALESLAMERPVVVSRTAGMDGYAPSDGGATLTAPGDERGMAAALEDLLLDQDRAVEQGLSGRREVIRSYSTATQARHLAEILAVAVSR